MKRFYVRQRYEATRSIRKANRLRKIKVRERLDAHGIEYVINDTVYEVEKIPSDIKRLIIELK